MVDASSPLMVQNLTQLTQGQEWRVTLLHSHPAPLLLWVTRGQGLMILDGLRRGVGAHNAIFVPAGHLLSLELARQSTVQAVSFDATLPLDLPKTPQHLRTREVDVQSELTGLIDAAAREAGGARPFKDDALSAHARLIAVWLQRQVATLEPTKPTAGERLSGAFIGLLARDYSSGQPMAHYAETLGVTPTHLTRAVKAACGKTAAEMITERVLHEAKRLLIDTTMPAQDIAQMLNFGSPAYFTRFIRQHTGQSPSQQRKR